MTRQHTVAVVIADQTSVFELAVPCEVFGLDRSDMGMPTYRFMVCGLHEGQHSTKGDLFTIELPYTLDDLGGAETMIVPAWDVNQPTSPGCVRRCARAQSAGCASRRCVRERSCSRRRDCSTVSGDDSLDVGRRAASPASRGRGRFVGAVHRQGNVLTSAGTAAAIDCASTWCARPRRGGRERVCPSHDRAAAP